MFAWQPVGILCRAAIGDAHVLGKEGPWARSSSWDQSEKDQAPTASLTHGAQHTSPPSSCRCWAPTAPTSCPPSCTHSPAWCWRWRMCPPRPAPRTTRCALPPTRWQGPSRACTRCARRWRCWCSTCWAAATASPPGRRPRAPMPPWALPSVPSRVLGGCARPARVCALFECCVCICLYKRAPRQSRGCSSMLLIMLSAPNADTPLLLQSAPTLVNFMCAHPAARRARDLWVRPFPGHMANACSSSYSHACSTCFYNSYAFRERTATQAMSEYVELRAVRACLISAWES